MKIAVVQFNAGPDKSKNIDRILKLVKRAIDRRAQAIFLPEVFNVRGANPKSTSENIPGDSTRPLMVLAKKYGVFILAGSICEQTAHSKKVYNTSVLIDEKGTIAAKYRKRHLFRAVVGGKRINESDRFLAGRNHVCVKVKRFRLGMTICYDLRFGDQYKRLADLGANVFCVPSDFTRNTGQAHWETLLRSRAIEHLSYVVAPNQIGTNGQGVPSYGHSMVVDPWGKVIAQASGNKEEIIYAQLNHTPIETARQWLPGI